MSVNRLKHPFAAVIITALLAGMAPLAQSVGTVDAVQIVAGGFVTDARVAARSAPTGQPVGVTVAVRSDTYRRALVDLEVYDRSGRKVFQKFWDFQAFSAGRTRQLTATWSTSGLATGTYTVKVGVFRAGWASLVHWNNAAATVTLTTAGATTTVPSSPARPTTAPSTTAPPPTTAPPTTAPPTTAPPTTAPPTTPTTTAPPTTAPPTTAPPTTAPPTTAPPTTAPPTTAPATSRFTTLPVGAALPSGATCAARVRPATEIRPENAAANNTRGSRANANTRTDWSGFSRVDGDFVGTTDQIIQWAACKWGIDEDVARAQVIKESYWYQSANGDNGESWGLGQVRDTAHQSAFQYSVNARNSSAYNLDYTYASWRACYEGVYTWLNTVERNGTYAAGDQWGCIGVWFSGRWNLNNDAYLNQNGDSVRWHYNNKTWLTSGFING